MAGLDGDYDAMLARHRPRQSEIMNRVTLDLGGTGQQGYSGEELLDDQRTRSDYSPALLERIFDMGRYWLLLSSGEFPVQPMSGEVNININLQVAHGEIDRKSTTSELQSLMRISYAVFCLKKKKNNI